MDPITPWSSEPRVTSDSNTRGGNAFGVHSGPLLCVTRCSFPVLAVEYLGLSRGWCVLGSWQRLSPMLSNQEHHARELKIGQAQNDWRLERRLSYSNQGSWKFSQSMERS